MMNRPGNGFALLLLFLSGCSGNDRTTSKFAGWAIAGNADNSHYSSLHQVNTANVQQLRVAWEYHTNDVEPGKKSELQCNPIIVDGMLYATSPGLKLFAVDAATGLPRWRFSPPGISTSVHVNRGVTFWGKGNDQRILFSAGPYLYVIHAVTGKPILSFGDSGRIDLREQLDADASRQYVIATSPGVVYKNLLIIGSRVSENNDAAPGHIRAFNLLTGKRAWIFHTIPRPGEFGYNTWPKDAWKSVGGVNCWSGMTLDAETGIVYVPLGSPSFDFYGGNRQGQNLFGNSLVALDAATGKRRWHFQTVHHDLWDRDLPAAPNLVTITRNNNTIKAVAQITKQGFVFVFNRKTGEPLFPIHEKPVPVAALAGEHPWPTQPYPEKPLPFVRQVMREADITTISDSARNETVQRFKAFKTGNLFTPPSKEGTIILPGFDGGGEWGGAAYDPATSTLYVNASEMPWVLTMEDAPAPGGPVSLGESIYRTACATCHGTDRKGEQHLFPSLMGIEKRMTATAIKEIITSGRGRMPSFKHLPTSDQDALVNFLAGKKTKAVNTKHEKYRPDALRYVHTGYHRFVDDNNYPAIKPPWGILAAINLNTGDISWKIPLGEYSELTAKGIPVTGTENYGGSIVTAGGLLFIAATKDEKFRAFDKLTGKLLWETTLPAGGYATPATYMVGGKQYIVIAAGGGKMGTPSADSYVAFALP